VGPTPVYWQSAKYMKLPDIIIHACLTITKRNLAREFSFVYVSIHHVEIVKDFYVCFCFVVFYVLFW